jgi:hypothetical protein
VNKSLKLSLITFSFIIPFFIPTIFISTIYAQIFEFDAEDYFDIEEEEKKIQQQILKIYLPQILKI